MPLNLDDKKALVAEVSAVAAQAQSLVAAEYRGLTVTEMTELRAKARGQGVYMRVVKNTLARRAVAGTAFENIGAVLKGPLVLAFSKDDPGAAARLVKAFCEGPRQTGGDGRCRLAGSCCRPRIWTRSRACRRASRRWPS